MTQRTFKTHGGGQREKTTHTHTHTTENNTHTYTHRLVFLTSCINLIMFFKSINMFLLLFLINFIFYFHFNMIGWMSTDVICINEQVYRPHLWLDHYWSVINHWSSSGRRNSSCTVGFEAANGTQCVGEFLTHTHTHTHTQKVGERSEVTDQCSCRSVCLRWKQVAGSIPDGMSMRILRLLSFFCLNTWSRSM